MDELSKYLADQIAFLDEELTPEEFFVSSTALLNNGQTNLDRAFSVNVHLSVLNVRYRESKW